MISYKTITFNAESVRGAASENCKGISWTYNEPTLWLEYTLDAATIAKERGLLTNYVTNGYITEEAMDLLGPHLDAYRVDLKACSPETYQKIANISEYRGILAVVKKPNTNGAYMLSSSPTLHPAIMITKPNCMRWRIG